MGNDDHDERLRARVHPADWVNPEPKARYHLVVIGGGTAGLVSAAGAAALGARVALVEKHLLGGDCLNYGCVPSKALLRSARAAADARHAGALGIDTGEIRVNVSAIMERLRRLRADISVNDSAQRFRDLGVDVFLSQAQFAGPDRVTVGDKVLHFRRAILATGTRPKIPSIPGLAEAGFLTNESVFALTSLPARLAVIGAGPIGCELAQAFARFGSRVTLLSNHPQIMPREDVDATAVLTRQLERDGITMSFCEQIHRIEVDRGETRLVLGGDGHQRGLAVDAILVATGRAPNVVQLGLEAAHVDFDAQRGVLVNDRLQTSNARIFAAGDVCSQFKFTHAADALARIAVQNALFFGRAKASALVIPWCTYTDPEIAHVGLSEKDAQQLGVPIDTFVQEFKHVDRATLDDDAEGFVKILVKKGADRILGATIVSRHAGDMIGEVTLAMVGKLGLKTLSRTIHPYPTHAEALRKVGDAYQKTRLTPTVRWLFQKWFQWTG